VSKITTHVLDVSRGAPAAGVRIRLEKKHGDRWMHVGDGRTDHDGRLRTLAPEEIEEGVYKITFDIRSYHDAQGVVGFYPEASIVFEVRDPDQHYHVPLLLSPFGYSTYRGS
jgi:5-hydroxyisourate hydrolase